MPAGHRFAKLASIPVLLVLLGFLGMRGLVYAQQQPILDSCNYDVAPGAGSVPLHFESNAQSAVAFNVYQGQTLFTVRQNTFFWDGSEWWVEVWTGLPNAKGTYWAEFDRLAPRCQPGYVRPQPVAPAPNPEPSRWFPGETLVVRSSVQFVWMRGSPSPDSSSIRTIFTGGGLLVEQQDAVRDGFGQWWWLVRDPISGETGWVEQSALQPGDLPPTPTPIPTLDLPTLAPPEPLLPTDIPLDVTALPTVDLMTLVPTVELLPTDIPPVDTTLPTADILPTDALVAPPADTPIPPVDLPTDVTPIDTAIPTVELPTVEPPQPLLPTDTVEVTPLTPAQPGPWQPGDRVRVRPALPFSWLRIIPSSESSWTVAVTRQELVILGGPQSDGLQSWWNVAVPSAGKDVAGWIEESALERVSS